MEENIRDAIVAKVVGRLKKTLNPDEAPLSVLKGLCLVIEQSAWTELLVKLYKEVFPAWVDRAIEVKDSSGFSEKI